MTDDFLEVKSRMAQAGWGELVTLAADEIADLIKAIREEPGPDDWVSHSDLYLSACVQAEQVLGLAPGGRPHSTLARLRASYDGVLIDRPSETHSSRGRSRPGWHSTRRCVASGRVPRLKLAQPELRVANNTKLGFVD